MCRGLHDRDGATPRRCPSSHDSAKRNAADRARYARKGIVKARAATVARQTPTELPVLAGVSETPSVLVVAVALAPATPFVSTRGQRRKILSQRGASVTIVSAERRAAPNEEFEPWAHRREGMRLVVTGSEGGQALLSDGTTLSSPESEWTYEDGLSIQTTKLTRVCYLLAPPTVPVQEATEPEDGDGEPTPSTTPAMQPVSGDEDRRARAAVEFEEAVRASIAASQLPPAEAMAAFSGVQDARKTASRLWEGAFRLPGEYSVVEWLAVRDHVDGGVTLTLAETENTAWIAKFEGAQRHLLGRITSEKTAGRGAVGVAEHEYELGLTLRGLVAEGRVLKERRARLERA
jgi:hypothetical protein